ncbi:hypothetical protein R1sor_016958 [Riccia sorocarpa]|uniref:Uncharacterized protein n=1 Tax=Riccia sorocarpa TaxID=122646 RepID=A0ABD3I9F6_9MARC
MDSGSGESDAKGEPTLITKSNVGLFVEDDSLLAHLHDFSEFVDGRKVAMKDTLKSGKVRAGVDVKDEKMLEAMPNAAKIWLEVTNSNGKGCRQEFSKASVKLLYAHVYLPNEEACIVDTQPLETQPLGSQPDTQLLGSFTIPRCSTSVPTLASIPSPAFGGLDADLVKRQLSELLRRV